MKNGNSRFEYHLQALEQLMNQAAMQSTPALWLYQNNARTPLFMLEGLSRLYSGLHNEKLFSKLKDRFKQLEDILGDIDYYDVYAKELSSTDIPAYIISYMQQRRDEEVQKLTEVLQEEEWLTKKNNRIAKIRKKLEEADWMKAKEEAKAIQEYYKEEIKEINSEFASLKEFTDVEEHLHDLRRDVRWLSIYPQALRGAIQLKESPVEPETQKYLTPEIVSSPFNQMPAPGNNEYVVLFNKNHFLAISWLINELGILKDKGLAVVAVTEAMDHKIEDDAEVVANVKQIAGKGETVSTILSRATAISKKFFAEKHLEKLVILE